MILAYEHPWASAIREFERDTLPELKKFGLQIGKSADSGNENAKRVIEHYVMIQRSFDPMTHILLRQDLVAWKTEQLDAK